MRLEILHVATQVVGYSRHAGAARKQATKRRGYFFDARPFGIGQRIRSPAFVQCKQNEFPQIRVGLLSPAGQQRTYGEPFPKERTDSRIGGQNILQFHGPFRGQVAVQRDVGNMFERRRHE